MADKFDVKILDDGWTYLMNRTINFGGNLINLHYNPREMLLEHCIKIIHGEWQHPINYDALKIINIFTDKGAPLNDEERIYLKEVFRKISKQIYYITWEGGYKLKHVSEDKELDDSYRIFNATVFNANTHSYVFDINFYAIAATKFSAKYLDKEIGEYRKFNIVNKLNHYLPITLRDLLFNYDVPSDEEPPLEARMAIDTAVGEIFYKTSEKIYHITELPEVSEIFESLGQETMNKLIVSDKFIEDIYIITLTDTFTKYVLKQIILKAEVKK